jgi:aryl-alcohol dehydrogenase-like predicted oxidoreductase
LEQFRIRRSLGHSALQVSPLGLGCWQFSKGSGMVGKFWPILSDEDITAIITTSLEGGINWFDTAEIYGGGQSEKALARSLQVLDAKGIDTSELLIATKWWPIMRTARSITQTIDQRIDCLDGRQIDLYQIHQPYSLSSIRSEMEAMASLIQGGKIRYAGVSNFSSKQMREAHHVLKEYGFHLVSNQVKYSLLDRRIESNGIMDTAKELGISIIAYSPLEQGLLTGKFHQDPTLVKRTVGPRRFQSKFKSDGLAKSRELIDLLQSLAVQYERTSSQIALNWLIHYHGDTVVAIPGASKVRHAVENVGALQFQLDQQELEAIDAASRKAFHVD